MIARTLIFTFAGPGYQASTPGSLQAFGSKRILVDDPAFLISHLRVRVAASGKIMRGGRRTSVSESDAKVRPRDYQEGIRVKDESSSTGKAYKGKARGRLVPKTPGSFASSNEFRSISKALSVRSYSSGGGGTAPPLPRYVTMPFYKQGQKITISNLD